MRSSSTRAICRSSIVIKFEGRMEKPISKAVLYSVLFFFALIGAVYMAQAADLQISNGAEYAARARPISSGLFRFAARGIIYDRNGVHWLGTLPARMLSRLPTLIRRTSWLSAITPPLRVWRTCSVMSNTRRKIRTVFIIGRLHGSGGVEKYYNSLLQGVNIRLVDRHEQSYSFAERSQASGGQTASACP